jgi:hypothetical protein
LQFCFRFKTIHFRPQPHCWYPVEYPPPPTSSTYSPSVLQSGVPLHPMFQVRDVLHSVMTCGHALPANFRKIRVNLQRFMHYLHVSVAPWLLSRSTHNMCVVEFRKGRTPAVFYRQYFAEMVPAYPTYTAIYTDGSLVSGSACCIFDCNERASRFQLVTVASTYLKLYTFYQELLYIHLQNRRHFFICSDFLVTYTISLLICLTTHWQFKLSASCLTSIRWAFVLCFGGFQSLLAFLTKMPPCCWQRGSYRRIPSCDRAVATDYLHVPLPSCILLARGVKERVARYQTVHTSVAIIT